jgi:signal transduction histidine kinase/CheY-like chemotaxis protein
MITPENSISILIIEDNPGDQLLLEANLGDTHLSIAGITMASTIEEGINCLKKENFSLVFLDFFLPDSNGLESYTALSKINSKIPVIILSGLSDTELSLKAITLGAQDFLLKGLYDCHSLEKAVQYSIERKKNIELLKQNNERYDIISKATKDIIWDWDILTDKIKWIGEGLKKYNPANLEPDKLDYNFWLNNLHPDERSSVTDHLKKSIQAGENAWESDYQFLRNDGKYDYINSRGYVIRNEEGTAIRMIGSMQDITERKTAEIETQKARIEAEEARKTQEQFLANMSHEIRTPMNGVVGMTELLAGTVLNKDQQDYVETIQESAANLMVIINDILDLTKIVAGKITIEKTDYNFSHLIATIIKTHKCKADKKGIQLKSNIDQQIYPVLLGDPVRLSQILNNLVGNAIKFTESGEVNLDVWLQKSEGKPDTLQFSISDTGIGIAEENAESVFERFTQVAGDSKRKYGGTGLGLTITKQLIELQGGKIQVKSKQGEGSVFSFYLPVEKGDCRQRSEIPMTSKEQDYQLKNLKILLAEDNLINQKVVIRVLTSQGAVVDIANHGREAIDMLKKKQYDLILMDLQMPEMDGYEATKIIRNDMGVTTSNTPIIAMTASALITDKTKCLHAGMNDYIAKPFLAGELYRKILSQVEKEVYSI